MRRLSFLLLVLVAAPTVARADAKACKAGAVIFGNPTYDKGEKPNPKGQTVKQDPPLEWHGLALAKGKVYTISSRTQDIWGGDVNGVVKRLAGAEESRATKFIDGKCADARFLGMRGIALQKDGSLVVADYAGNAVRTVTDPEGPTCTVTTLVGPPAPYDISAAKVPAPGDVDGAAKQAQIGAPEWVITDDSGNIYFIDSLAGKLKKIAADADHTVSTLATLKANGVLGFTAMTFDKKVYVTGNTILNGIIWEVDPQTGKTRTVINANSEKWPGLANTSPTLTAIASDGKDLIVTGQSYIWRVTKDGKTVAPLAGIGYALNYPDKYNPNGVYPVNQLALRMRTDDGANYGSSTNLVWADGGLYFRGRHFGAYVMKIGCP